MGTAREMAGDPAQRELDAAVERFLSQGEWEGAGVLTGWVLVGQHQSADDEGEPTTSYGAAYMNGSMPDAVVIGMLEIGRDRVRGVGRWAADE